MVKPILFRGKVSCVSGIWIKLYLLAPIASNELYLTYEKEYLVDGECKKARWKLFGNQTELKDRETAIKSIPQFETETEKVDRLTALLLYGLVVE